MTESGRDGESGHVTSRGRRPGDEVAVRTADPGRLGDEFRVLVVGPSGTGGVRQYIDGQVARLELPVDVHDSGSPSSGSGLTWLLAAVVQGLAAMARFAVRERPDLVHVHSSYQYSFYRAAFYVLYARYVWQTPVVLHVHGSSFDEFVQEASLPVAALQRVVFAASDRIVVLSEYWREVLAERASPDKLTVVPNAVDPDLIPADVGDERPHVVFVSNLVERKGVAELVTAVDSLVERTDERLQVTIAGDGPLANEVEALAEPHDEVTYLGYVSEERKRSLLAEGSIFVLPTYAEGLPIAMLEGMAGGNAIVATDVGSIPEVIDERRGILVPPGDADALAAALEELVAASDRRREMARRNRRAVEDDYSWGAVIDELLAIYRSVSSS